MPGTSLLFIESNKKTAQTLSAYFHRWGFSVTLSTSETDAFETLSNMSFVVVILSMGEDANDRLNLLKQIKNTSPTSEVIVLTVEPDLREVVTAIKQGAYDFLALPVDLGELKQTLDKLQRTKLQHERKIQTKNKFKTMYGFENIIYRSKAMHDVIEMVKKISSTKSSTVLINGATGTGKELIARAIHYNSKESNGSFIEVNCGAIPETLLESELFGHEAGAFTDAKKQKKGLIELASGGTLFLDEIGETSLNLQVKLLKVIEEKCFRRLGGSQKVSVDLRIIAATNKDLKKMVMENLFREDLYYRLNIMAIKLPPISERIEDIPLFVDYFIDQFNREFDKHICGLTPKVEDIFKNYHWPGNVRELRNTLERLVLLEDNERITEKYIPIEINDNINVISTKGEIANDVELLSSGLGFDSLQVDLIKQALQRSNGNVSQAARLLKMTRETLRYRIRKFGLSNQVG